MANPEHVEILKRGVTNWNAWRKANPHPQSPPDLNGAEFKASDLHQADLSGVFLNGANLVGADLSQADLSWVTLMSANLSGANLMDTNLKGVHLNDANLSGANLVGAHLSKVDLKGANLDDVLLGNTQFENCETLHQALNLQCVRHQSPSLLDSYSLEMSFQYLDKYQPLFLQQMGYSDEELSAFRKRYLRPIQYPSCYIAFERPDLAFVDELKKDLEKKSINWVLSPLRSKWWFPKYIDSRGIMEQQSKVLLVCSRESLMRDDLLANEIVNAVEAEREKRVDLIIRIDLEAGLWKGDIGNIGQVHLRHSKLTQPLVECIRRAKNVDFSDWTDDLKFKSAFEELVKLTTEV